MVLRFLAWRLCSSLGVHPFPCAGCGLFADFVVVACIVMAGDACLPVSRCSAVWIAERRAPPLISILAADRCSHHFRIRSTWAC